MTEAPFTIHLVRHGESVGNANGYYQGQSDFPLTETGRAQARALAELWQVKGVTFDQIVSSPLVRARETSEIIAGILNIPIDLDPLWMERNNGLMAGLSHDDIRGRELEVPFLHPYQHVGRTGESETELYARAARAVQSLIDRGPGRYLVASHGGILNKVMYVILGIPVQANFHGPSFLFENTSYAALTYNPDIHKWRVLEIGNRSHWPVSE